MNCAELTMFLQSRLSQPRVRESLRTAVSRARCDGLLQHLYTAPARVKPTNEQLARGNADALVLLERADELERLAQYAERSHTEEMDRAKTLRDLGLRLARGTAEVTACPDCNRSVWRIQMLRGEGLYEAGRYLHPHYCHRAP